MRNLNGELADYLESLNERAKKSRIYQQHQLIGLQLALLLEDNEHKSLYIRMAKNYDNQKLLGLAKKISEMKHVQNKGAYFMKIFYGDK